MTGSMASFDTPTTCAVGRAGFDSGPRKLNTVGIPISFRGPPACAIAAWNTGANMNPMPASCRHRDTSADVSPFDRSATTNAAICAGVASPAMIRRIASAASCDERSSRATRRLRIPGQKSVTAPIPPSAKYPRQGRPNQRQAEQEHQDVPSLDLPRLHGVEAHRPVLRRLPQPVVLTELLFGEPV